MTRSMFCMAGILVFLLSSCQLKEKDQPVADILIPYPEVSLPPAKRAQELLAIMSLEEKAGQMTQIERGYLKNINDITTFHLGSLLSGGGSVPASNTAVAWADMIDSFQNKALNTRLRIPLLYGTDAVHGHNNLVGATIFPHNIGLGATRNPRLIEKIAEITAKEASSTGVHWNFSPSISVPQNIRWGRTYEGFSEIAEISGMLGAAAIRGYQGQHRFIATAKHFAGDGATFGGKDQGNAIIGLDVLSAIHARPYIDAIHAGVKTVMASFNSWNGVKVHGSKELLTDLLRLQLGFEGVIVSDWGAVKQLSGSKEDQVVQAIMAGIDVVMVPDEYKDFIQTLISAVKNGRISMERIDDAVFRILKLKFELGLFENPKTDRSAIGLIGSPEHRLVARQAVRESLVVLKNNGVLPISKNTKHIHVLGNKANDIGVQCGGWTITWQGTTGSITQGTSVLQGFQSSAAEFGAMLSYGDVIPTGTDLVVLVVGEHPYAEFEGDTDEPRLDSADLKAHQIASNSKLPVITVMISGRPMIITDQIGKWDAFVAAWLPGTEGDGLADILFGRHKSTGILPITWPRSMKLYELRDQLAGNNPNYQDPASEILFPVGFGL